MTEFFLSSWDRAARSAFADLVHPEAWRNPALGRRHQALIAAHLVGGFLTLLAFVVYFAWFRGMTPGALWLLAWFALPLACVTVLRRTGWLELAQALSGASLAALVVLALIAAGPERMRDPTLVVLAQAAAVLYAGALAFAAVGPGRQDREGAGMAAPPDAARTAAPAAANTPAPAAVPTTDDARSLALATLGHELRTPLNGIIGFAELMHRDLGAGQVSPKHVEYCRIIHDQGQHLLGVVNDLLDVARLEAGHLAINPQPMDVTRLVASIVESQQPAAAQRGIHLTAPAVEGDIEAVADPRALRQALLNLVSNAIKFTRNGGRVTVSAHREPDGLLLSVSDTGIGIAPTEIPRLGRPFYQADQRRNRDAEGVGLGLAITKGLVELHGGRLEIASALGQGTTMTLRLPTAPGAETHDRACADAHAA